MPNPLPSNPKPPSAKFTSQSDAHMRTNAKIKFLYYPLMTDLKQQEMKELVPASFIFLQVPSKLEINTMYHWACIFHIILLGIPSSFVLSVKNKGDGWGFHLADKICQG